MSERIDVDRAVAHLREPVRLDPALDDRVMQAVRAGDAPQAWARPIWSAASWLGRRRTIRVSPLSGLAVAAGLAVLWIAAGQILDPSSGVVPATGTEGTVVQFVIVAPSAGSVTVVGDFNDWMPDATPLSRAPGDGVWSVTVPLDPGRYRYSFLVDDEVWLSDPSAPPAQDDEFGRPGSVVTVGEI